MLSKETLKAIVTGTQKNCEGMIIFQLFFANSTSDIIDIDDESFEQAVVNDKKYTEDEIINHFEQIKKNNSNTRFFTFGLVRNREFLTLFTDTNINLYVRLKI